MRELQTQRLLIRAYQSRDFEELLAMLADPELMRNFYHGHSLTLNEATAFINRYVSNFSESDEAGLSSLCLKESGSLIGLAGLMPCNYLCVDDVEIGFLVGTEYQGKGYAKEAATKIVEYCLKDLKRERLLALVHPENVPSRRLIEGEQNLFMRFHSEIQTEDRGPRRVYCLPRGV